ncbi:MAG TPA: ABC transporter ATP-binding protein [Caldithrix abyssi]|uniref:ABC transporter ATP-binding protein n=1 Tax=Caldithrix abyssi TaxID=187145 RepID=A0A7V5RPV8_CALAY|nr:ABC transporter ATP-binding protein [Caldithrix abyssi]
MRYVFREIIWPRKGLLFLGLFLIIVNRLSGLALPGASKYLIDDVIAGGDLVMMRWLLIAVTAAVAIQAATSFALTRLLSVEAHHLIAQLRLKLQKHILQLPVAFFDNQKSGALVARIMSDAEGVRNLVGTGFVQLLGGMLTAIVAFVILLNINVTLTFVALVPMALFGLISLKAFGFIRPIFRERSVINAEVTGRLTETLSGIRVIKGFNAEEQESAVFARGVERLFNNVKKSLTSTSLVTSAATLLMGLASAAIMGLGGYYIIANQMTMGDLFAFTLYLGFMIAPIIQMGNIGSQITEAFAGLDRMDELLKSERETDDANRALILNHIKGDVVFNDVHFHYEEGKPVLRGISFTAPAGSVTALVGSSGSGKTTISGLVASFLKPVRGTITVDGHDLTTIDLAGYRSHLGVVLQDDFLFEGTIRENILFARPDAGEEELRAAVEAAWVAEFADRFDEGLETVIGERGVKLSGGQRQRVAIARAILADPRILILDEATSSLDTESEKYIQQSLQKLMKGRTTFVIAHRLSTIRQADQILVIENGEIAERGAHEELIARKGRYFQLYTYQARI